MRVRLFVLSIALSAGLAASANAQSAGSAAALASMTSQMNTEQMNQQFQQQGLEQQQDSYHEDQNPRRVRRANEAAELINKGDCAGARALAAHANDTRLLTRIDQVCTAMASTPAQTTSAQ